MQSLQADQSLYNRKGVCYISLSIGHFSGVKNTSILNRDRKYNKLSDISCLNQRKTYSYHPQIEKTHSSAHRTPISEMKKMRCSWP